MTAPVDRDREELAAAHEAAVSRCLAVADETEREAYLAAEVRRLRAQVQAAANQRAAEELLAPGDPDARMHAYYYSFDATGIGLIDAILSAVAQAGKSYHSTESWADEDEWTTPSHETRIQAAADQAASRLRAALAQPAPTRDADR